MSASLHRRQLTPSQRALVAAKAREFYDKQAKERQKRKSAGFVPETLPEQKGDSRDKAGKAAGVSGKLVDHATKVLRRVALAPSLAGCRLRHWLDTRPRRAAFPRDSAIRPPPVAAVVDTVAPDADNAPGGRFCLTTRAKHPTKDSAMVFHQATSPAIRARNQAMIRSGGEQGRAAALAAV